MTSDFPVDETRMRVLVLAPHGRDAALIGDVLAAAGVVAQCCGSIPDLTERMREGAGAAIIVQEALAADTSELLATMEAQPSWSDFPLIVLADREKRWRQVPAALVHVVILPRPSTPESLVSIVRASLQSRRRQYQLEAYLDAQRQRVAEVLEGIFDGYLSMDWSWRCVYVNETGARLLGKAVDELVGSDMRQLMPHWSADGFEQCVRTVMDTGHPFLVEEYCPSMGRWFDVRCGRSVDGVSFFYSDITPRKKSEEHLQMVINELSHRVKNTLAVIQSIADQTFKADGSLETVRSAFQGRLSALAETHTLLTASHWESVDLAALVEHSVGHLSSGGRRVRAAGARVKLTPKAALAIGMTLHELSTNAAKYGALAGEAGSVEVRWRTEAGDLVVDWLETAAAAVALPTRKGFGTRMVDQAIEYELGGAVSRDYRPTGLHCHLAIPLATALCP
jgi:two-component sensor histidine kinase